MASHNLQTPLKLCTYNSGGQEHWYFDNEINYLESSVGNVQAFGISVLDNDEIIIGRPHGGCAILKSDAFINGCHSLITHISKL